MAGQECLAQYYRQFFPCEEMVEWLSCGHRPESKDPYYDAEFFSKREFSFTLPGDIYCRYLSFGNAQELRETLVRQMPDKIDAGAVFNFNPRSKNSGSTRRYEPVERELVFDIDMTDYDNVRTCCMGAKLCNVCWQYMVVAAQALKIALKESFGFTQILWVFSGRRGIHCWVCDEKARRLTNMQRKTIVEFLVGGPHFHSPFEQIYEEVFLPAFEDVVVQRQGIFQYAESSAAVVKALKNEECKAILVSALREGGSSVDVWSRFKEQIRGKSPVDQKRIFMDLTFTLMFPRLDVHVSTAMNHLLKLPFSIHPATGKVCVPFELENIEMFNVEEVPTLAQLLEGEKTLTEPIKLLKAVTSQTVVQAKAERSAQIALTRSLEASNFS